MLKDFAAVATVAVKDLDRAKVFYRDQLGLDLTEEEMGVLTFKSGDGLLFVYQSAFAGTNQATSVTWSVEDAQPIAAALKTRGISFEHYDDLPGLELAGDVYVAGSMKVVWFKDSDGNVLSVVSGG